MEESEEGNFLKTDEKPELGFPSPPPSPPLDLAELENLVAEFQNLESKEDDASSSEAASVLNEEKKRRFHYPLRPGQPACAFYMRTGTCKFGSNCKFNHPRRRKVIKDEEKEKDKKEKEDEGNEENWNEDFHEKEGTRECKYYLMPGGCKFGKACRYSHSRGKAGVEEPVDLNFLGLPIRPGQRECPFYMRTGSCKFAINCRFHHPDPTAVGGSDPHPVYQNGTSLPLHAPPASSSLPIDWSSQTTSNESAPYMEVSPPPYQPVMMSHLHGVHPNVEWNEQMGLASPLFSAERYIQAPSVSPVNDMTKKADRTTCQMQKKAEEFPERPGQSECQFYMKFGDCKFKSACRYHHPKNRISKSSASAGGVSPIGLPLRPDKNICAYFSRYGICKFGPSCKFDHPINSDPSAAPATHESDQPSSLEKSTSEEVGVLTC